MKITKNKLRQLIKEELGSLKELESTSASDLRRQRMARARTSGQGVSKDERSMLDVLEQALNDAAAQENIAIGRTRRLVELLLQQLEKLGVTITPPDVEGGPDVPEPGPAAGGGGPPTLPGQD